MRVERRTVLAAGSVLAVSGLLVGGRALAGAPAAAPVTRAALAQLVGRRVRLTGEGTGADATLTAVEDLLGSAAGDPRAFSVLYRPEGTELPQGVYAVDHPGLATAHLLVVPVGTGLGRTYQIIINQKSGA